MGYDQEVNRQKRIEEKKRLSALGRRPSKELLSGDGGVPPELDRPDLHPDLASQISARSTSKEALQPKGSKDSLQPRGSKDSRVSLSAEASGDKVPIARERRSIKEVLKDRPDKGGSSKFLKDRNLDPE